MRKIKNKKYHYFYKITNLINNHFYYGIHSTDDLEDGYMGSGSRLHMAYEKYGIENFEKEILKFFNSREECAEYEMEIVTEELIHNNDCYNIILGGDNFNMVQTVTAKDTDNNYYRVSIFDKRYINGELKSMHSGEIQVRKKGSLDRFYYIPLIEYYKNKNIYEVKNTNKILAKNVNGENFMVDINDERLLTGELVNFWVNRKHKDEARKKMCATHKLNKHQQGEKNSQYGTCWIYKDGENKKIKKDELEIYIQNGWVKGRKIKK